MDKYFISPVFYDDDGDLVTDVLIPEVQGGDDFMWYPQDDGTFKVVVVRKGIPQGHLV